jgi:lipid-A-disaccharide synthase-like uncharacterized protein
MAPWFFLLVGAALIGISIAVADRSPILLWVLGALGGFVVAFGIIAPRRAQVAVLDSIVALFTAGT